MPTKRLTIQNARILTPFEFIECGSVVIEDGRIVYIGPVTDRRVLGQEIDARGHYLVPGFIDLQVNGGFGFNFTADPESIWKVAAQLPRYGVTAFLPTIVSSPLETVSAAQQLLSRGRPAAAEGATPLGLHAEGPFLNPKKKGAHNPAHLRPVDPDAVEGWSRESGVRLVTLAPELPGAQALVHRLLSQGVVVSAGHTMANYEQALAGFNAGVRYGTHLFNAMHPAGHRDPGIVGALLIEDACTVGLICDGVHVHAAMVNLAWKAKGQTRLNLVSDATTALGMPPGNYTLGDRTVTVTESDARLADGTLAGSMTALDQALRNLKSFTGATLPEALPTVTSTPATLLGIMDQRGHLAAGKVADLVLLTPDLHVQMTIVNGHIVYNMEPDGQVDQVQATGATSD
jgi:N-acetylglucosamine-6-phosphate deacetylase